MYPQYKCSTCTSVKSNLQNRSPQCRGIESQLVHSRLFLSIKRTLDILAFYDFTVRLLLEICRITCINECALRAFGILSLAQYSTVRTNDLNWRIMMTHYVNIDYKLLCYRQQPGWQQVAIVASLLVFIQRCFTHHSLRNLRKF